MASRSYVIAMLRHLHENGASSSSDLWKALALTRGRFPFPEVGPGVGTAIIDSALRELAELGVVEEGPQSWRLTQPPRAGESSLDLKPAVRGGGTEPPGTPPPGNGGDDGANGQGGNLGEVLRHEILFALGREDFEDAVDRAVQVFG